MTNNKVREKEELLEQMKGTAGKIRQYEAEMKTAQLQGDIDTAFQKKKALDFAKDWFAELQRTHKKLYFQK